MMCKLYPIIYTCILECPEEVPSFEGSPGLTVDGQVVPPIEGVSITIELEDGERLETTTDSIGQVQVSSLLSETSHAHHYHMLCYQCLGLDPFMVEGSIQWYVFLLLLMHNV